MKSSLIVFEESSRLKLYFKLCINAYNLTTDLNDYSYAEKWFIHNKTKHTLRTKDDIESGMIRGSSFNEAILPESMRDSDEVKYMIMPLLVTQLGKIIYY